MKKIEEDERKILIDQVDKDNRFKELEIIIKEQYNQFITKQQEILIEYLKTLQKYLEELQMKGIDRISINTEIRIIMLRLQREVKIKYERICKSLIEETLRGKYDFFLLNYVLFVDCMAAWIYD